MENQSQQQLAPVVGLKNWIIYIIISSVPILGFVMLIIWAFSGPETNPNKRNWAKAFIIIQVACIILVVLAYVFVALAGLTMYKINS